MALCWCHHGPHQTLRNRLAYSGPQRDQTVRTTLNLYLHPPNLGKSPGPPLEPSGHPASSPNPSPDVKHQSNTLSLTWRISSQSNSSSAKTFSPHPAGPLSVVG